MKQMAERTYAAYLGEFFVSIKRDTMLEDAEIIFQRVKVVLEERKKQIAEGKQTPKDFLDSCLSFFKDDDRSAIFHIGGLLAGAYETTTTLISWLLYAFSVYPAEALKVTKEVEQIIGLDATEITYADLNKLVYLEKFLKETLRLYPPAPFSTDRTIEIPKRVGKYTFPPGKIFALNILAIHRNPKYWEDPEVFNPENFDPEKDNKRHP
jgi:cytochrome P450